MIRFSWFLFFIVISLPFFIYCNNILTTPADISDSGKYYISRISRIIKQIWNRLYLYWNYFSRWEVINSEQNKEPIGFTLWRSSLKTFLFVITSPINIEMFMQRPKYNILSGLALLGGISSHPPFQKILIFPFSNQSVFLISNNKKTCWVRIK